jgi:hypothetical protein
MESERKSRSKSSGLHLSFWLVWLRGAMYMVKNPLKNLQGEESNIITEEH